MGAHEMDLGRVVGPPGTTLASEIEMAGYEKANTYSPVLSSDSVRDATGKLETAATDAQYQKLNGYTKPAATGEILPTDSTKQAIGKLDARPIGGGDMKGSIYDPGEVKGDAFLSSNHKLSGYTKPSTPSAVEPTDNAAAALGKVEAAASAAMPKAGGAFTGVVGGPVTTSAAAIYRNIQVGTSDLTAGTSALASGSVYLVYE